MARKLYMVMERETGAYCTSLKGQFSKEIDAAALYHSEDAAKKVIKGFATRTYIVVDHVYNYMDKDEAAEVNSAIRKSGTSQHLVSSFWPIYIVAAFELTQL